ncbi:Twin-arginine translocation protein TatA [Euzebya pacifica]|jgi:sec-independent protein translocase protein TatA|uniref:Sec-independent protein translocase protein TatA n=1 Tax=Euzebya pacifica TaxID=1608957 RepID=A0A346XYG7_9ACTN|nr:twin-arginine translocase TatA/TatE family subunit [Euzebya pacifica]AXV07264.1 Twin-arginine translocation protein TatA [Euzebya pacifica]
MNLGPTEIIVLAVLVIVLFGAKKLPELGSSVGKTITNFRKGMSEAEIEAQEEARAESRSESVDSNDA